MAKSSEITLGLTLGLTLPYSAKTTKTLLVLVVRGSVNPLAQ